MTHRPNITIIYNMLLHLYVLLDSVTAGREDGRMMALLTPHPLQCRLPIAFLFIMRDLLETGQTVR